MLTATRLLLLIALVFFSTMARAQSPVSAAPSVPSESSTGYRASVMTADAAAYGQVAAGIGLGLAVDEDAGAILAATGFGTYLVGAPLVHGVHGRWDWALLSLGARLALPVVGMYAGLALAQCTRGEWLCGVGEAAAGLTVGMLAASTVDAAIISPSDAGEQRAAERPRPTGLALAPSVVATPNLALVGLGGRF